MVIFSVFSGPVPSDGSQVWRYMSFVSFVSLLQRRELFFCRPECFEDPFEGAVPPAIARLYSAEEAENQTVGGSDKLWKLAMLLRRQREEAGFFRVRRLVNRWDMHDGESAAMWKLYGDNSSVAIQSTKIRLMKGFDAEGSSVSISPVTYFDYSLNDLSSIPLSPDAGLPEQYKLMITPDFCFKRKSFEHERELRVTASEVEGAHTEGAGKYIRVNLEALMEKVYVSPLAPAWVADVVRQEMNQYGLSAQEVVHSTLYTERLA